MAAPNTNNSIPLHQLLFLTLSALVTVLVCLGIRAVYGNPKCDEPLVSWVQGFVVGIGVLCILNGIALFVPRPRVSITVLSLAA